MNLTPKMTCEQNLRYILIVWLCYVFILQPHSQSSAAELMTGSGLPAQFLSEKVFGEKSRPEELTQPDETLLPAEINPVVPGALDLPPSDETWSGSNSPLVAKPVFRLRGRVDTDFISVNQSAANKTTFGNLQDSVGLRRARIGGQGNLAPDVRYIGEIDLANTDTVVIRDLFIGLGEIQGDGELRAGHFREPFSLEGATSANSYAFLERSPINSFDPARNWGLGYFRCSPDEDSTLGMGVFHSGVDANDFHQGDASDTSATIKWTALPWYEDEGRRLVHLGIATSSRIPDNGFVILNEKPRSPLLQFGDSSGSPFVPAIRIPSHFRQLFNAQWAYVDGPFSAQAEWYGTLVDQSGGQSLFYHGSYLNLSYFLTGEHRAYQTQNGMFGAVTVEQPALRHFSSKEELRAQGYGAWELTAQLAYADLFDPQTPPGPQGQLVGVKLPQVTVGVNWYLADRLRLMFNYSHAMPDEPNVGSSSASLFSTRLAMFW